MSIKQLDFDTFVDLHLFNIIKEAARPYALQLIRLRDLGAPQFEINEQLQELRQAASREATLFTENAFKSGLISKEVAVELLTNIPMTCETITDWKDLDIC